MHTAQRIIRNYRRKRLSVCISLAIAALFLTLSVRFISERNLYERQITDFSQRAILSIEALLAPLEKVGEDLAPLVGHTCTEAHLPLREQAARLQIVRAIALVDNGVLYCSSIFGARNVLLNQIQPRLPSPVQQLLLSTDQVLLKGTPVLIRWLPTSLNGQSGVMQIINIELITSLSITPDRPLIRRVLFNVGPNHLEYGSDVRLPPEGERESRQVFPSSRYPFSVTVIGPTPEYLAWRDLPGQLPLALILSLLIGYMAWLATAGRMSFSWEINLGLAAREFEVFCQPLLSARTQQCVGVEILLRWNNPRQGWISPDVFIPLAEQQNLIAPLTRYVMTETVHQLHYFPADSAFHIGINVAASHFHRGAILDDVRRIWLSAHPHQQLILELTERDALPDVDHRMVRELHRYGVKLAIDDFGTGQSALSYLEKLHPDVLKIDKSFTAAIGTDAVNSTVTDIIIALGQRLNIELVAEGVETEAQAAHLKLHGVTFLQGYLYAKPMPLREFPQWLAGRTRPPARHNGQAIPVLPVQ
ncbi:EAL domain-containing protein [Siccibacter turicensis]|uniref:EAL domain-containing protein n=1 Tax=Siccibacter turicensis TaxID=357233 RepID=UPI003F550180